MRIYKIAQSNAAATKGGLVQALFINGFTLDDIAKYLHVRLSEIKGYLARTVSEPAQQIRSNFPNQGSVYQSSPEDNEKIVQLFTEGAIIPFIVSITNVERRVV